MGYIIGVKQNGLNGSQELQQDGTNLNIVEDFTIVYTVISNENATTKSILYTPGLPRIGSYSAGLMCKKLTPSRDTLVILDGVTKSKWTITAEYSSEFTETDPTELPPEVSWSSEIYEEVLKWDVDNPNQKVVTKCGEPLILTRRRVMPVLTIKRTEEAPFPPMNILEYTNTINQNPFWGSPAKHALLEGINATYKQVELTNGDKKWYVDVSYVIKFRFDPNTNQPWQAQILHHGTKYFKVQGAEAQCWDDGNGNTGTINLDANGLKLADGAEPVYLSFNVYETKDWSALKIDTDEIRSIFV